MDIFGSALSNPTVSWNISRNTNSKQLKRAQKLKEEETMDRIEQTEKPPIYQTGSDEWETPKKRSFPAKLKELFRRVKGSSADETQPLLTNRPKNKPKNIPREKLKVAGKRFRKALHKSIGYMAIGMENMSTMIYISANVPSSVYYSRNNYDNYDQSMPSYC